LSAIPIHAEESGRIEIRDKDHIAFAWQKAPLLEPVGGAKFSASAFIHPLCTPAGFGCTTIQPTDHLHHLGLWWPWKFVEVNGKKYNTWEIQEGQGGHVARSVKTISSDAGKTEWEFDNETVIKPQGAEPVFVIHETARVALTLGAEATVLDISLQQKAAGAPVTISSHRYSGFSWRGPASWNKDNSTMTTSGGKGRDDANGTLARWLMVSGPSPHGTATVLIMSAAQKQAGTPEKLRVWDSRMSNGTPFVNFNPVMNQSLPLDNEHPAVSHRRYRVIATDRVIDAKSAEAEWQKWAGA